MILLFFGKLYFILIEQKGPLYYFWKYSLILYSIKKIFEIWNITKTVKMYFKEELKRFTYVHGKYGVARHL